MAINSNPTEWLYNLTRAAMDDKTYLGILARSNTALYLMMKDPLVQKGSGVVSNIVYKEKTARLVNTGRSNYDGGISNPNARAGEPFAMATMEYEIDGKDFWENTGVELDAIDSGSFGPGHARTLVNAYKSQFEQYRDGVSRQINDWIVNGKTVNNNTLGTSIDSEDWANDAAYLANRAQKFWGLKTLTDSVASNVASWGGLKADDLGATDKYHKFNRPQTIRKADGTPKDSPTDADLKQLKWAPVVYDYGVGVDGTTDAAAVAKSGDDGETKGLLDIGGGGTLYKVMTALNHGGSQIRPSMAFDAEYVALMSQNTRGEIIRALGDQVSRNLNPGSEANTDLTGMRRVLTLDEFELELYADSSVPDGVIYIWNPAAIRLAMFDKDMKYAKRWVFSTSNYTALIPFRKLVQMAVRDLSQAAVIKGIEKIARFTATKNTIT